MGEVTSRVMKQLLNDIEKRYKVERAYFEYGLFDRDYTLRLKFKLVDLHFAYVISEQEISMLTSDYLYETFRTHNIFARIDDEICKYVRKTFYAEEETKND